MTQNVEVGLMSPAEKNGTSAQLVTSAVRSRDVNGHAKISD